MVYEGFIHLFFVFLLVKNFSLFQQERLETKNLIKCVTDCKTINLGTRFENYKLLEKEFFINHDKSTTR